MATVELRNVSKSYGVQMVVNDVSFTLADRELLALLGPSGCGKTTTLRMLGGFIQPDSGQILVDGKEVTSLPPEQRPTAMVFQSYALWPHMTVADNIGFGLKLRKLSREVVAQKTAHMLDVVGLQGVEKRYPAQLSGGQQQRVALARALVLEPKILLLDEPLSNLDAKLRVRMRDEIRRIQQELRITTVYVTHDQEEALTMADRIAVMEAGVVQQMGTAVQIYEEPSTPFVADFIGSSNFYTGHLSRAAGGAWAQIGRLRVPVWSDGLADGAQVSVSVRPEDIEIIHGGTPAADAFPLEDARLVNFGAYKRLIARNPDLGEVDARVEKDFAIHGAPLHARIVRARAYAAQ